MSECESSVVPTYNFYKALTLLRIQMITMILLMSLEFSVMMNTQTDLLILIFHSKKMNPEDLKSLGPIVDIDVGLDAP